MFSALFARSQPSCISPCRPARCRLRGYAEGSTHIHHSHALAAAVAAVVLFGIGWFAGRR
jgi:hypothetical protein